MINTALSKNGITSNLVIWITWQSWRSTLPGYSEFSRCSCRLKTNVMQETSMKRRASVSAREKCSIWSAIYCGEKSLPEALIIWNKNHFGSSPDVPNEILWIYIEALKLGGRSIRLCKVPHVGLEIDRSGGGITLDEQTETLLRRASAFSACLTCLQTSLTLWSMIPASLLRPTV